MKLLKLVALFSLVFLIAACNPQTNGYTIDNGVILLDKEGTIPSELCQERNLQDQIIVLESKYCHACETALPKMKDAAKELALNLVFLDLSEKADYSRVNQLKILPHYTPTLIVKCHVYIGDKSKEDYLAVLRQQS